MIHRFKEENAWASNFAPCEIRIGIRTYPSVEHAYMSQKSDDGSWKDFCTDPTNTPGEVKRRSRSLDLREDWQEVRLEAMRRCLEQKFAQEPYMTKLLQTGDQNIVEGNTWKDRFWGVDVTATPNIGENHLGRMLMEIRAELRKALK